MAFKNAPKAWLNGVTVGNVDIDDNSITSAKISAGTIVAADIASNAITSAKISAATIVSTDLADNAVTLGKTSSLKGLYMVRGYQAAGAAASHLIRFQTYGACTIMELGLSQKLSGGSGTSTVLEVCRGAGATASTVVLAAQKMKKGSTLKVFNPVSTSGVVADNGTVVVNITGVTSTCTGLNAWLWIKQAITQ